LQYIWPAYCFVHYKLLTISVNAQHATKEGLIVNTKKYAFSLSLAIALGTSMGAQANDKTEWGKIISYGNTTIAQDTPDDFGPWKMMVQPAAGPAGAPLTMAAMQLPTPIPPTPTPIPTPTPQEPVTPHISIEVVTATNVIPPPPPPPAVAPPPPLPTPTDLPASRTRTR
jgi:hypothetical protein